MRNINFVFAFIILLGSVGCGGKVATNMVEGFVTLDGAPLADAMVTFSPVSSETGMIAVGRSDTSGKFTLQTQLGAVGKGTTEGEYIVSVTKIEAVQTGKSIKNDSGETVKETTEKSAVPDLYTKSSTSPLKQTIVKGLNKVEVKLLSKP